MNKIIEPEITCIDPLNIDYSKSNSELLDDLETLNAVELIKQANKKKKTFGFKIKRIILGLFGVKDIPVFIGKSKITFHE
jgi:hypothetical protein